jgi:acetyl-CoA carboxylase carboxyl transferase subunit alpha
MAALLRRALADSLRQFHGMSVQDVRERRFDKLMAYGKFMETLPGA